jgi:hypothetical protein
MPPPPPPLRWAAGAEPAFDGQFYARQNGTWVAINSTGSIPEAPSDGNIYGRQNKAWTKIKVAQYQSVIIPVASAVPLSTGTPVNVGTVTLPAGVWFVSGELWISVTSGTPAIQQISAAITNASATIPTGPSDSTGLNLREPQQTFLSGSQLGAVLPIAPVYLTPTISTPYYLVASTSWTGTGTIVAFGKIAGRYYS